MDIPDTSLKSSQCIAPAPPTEGDVGSDITKDVVQLGQTEPVQADSDLYCLTIIGQIEGHLVLPPQNKTTKYEHIIPQLVAAEQNDHVKGLLLILSQEKYVFLSFPHSIAPFRI
jgi:ATP-dependent protease ClpP protease subunit